MEYIARKILLATSLALLLLGLSLGFMPQTGPGDGAFGGGSVDCGSPFVVDGGLTDFGRGACESEGLAERRAWAVGWILASIAIGWTGLQLGQDAKKSPALDPDGGTGEDGALQEG